MTQRQSCSGQEGWSLDRVTHTYDVGIYHSRSLLSGGGVFQAKPMGEGETRTGEKTLGRRVPAFSGRPHRRR